MSDTGTTENSAAPAAGTVFEISRKDLPLHCPTPEQSLWNSHPRVYLPIEDSGSAKCPYCGSDYTLKD